MSKVEVLKNCDRLKELLYQRSGVHGSYDKYTEIYGSIVAILHDVLEENNSYTDKQKQQIIVYLNNIMNKVARIVTSEGIHKDNFIDIAGYSILAMSSC